MKKSMLFTIVTAVIIMFSLTSCVQRVNVPASSSQVQQYPQLYVGGEQVSIPQETHELSTVQGKDCNGKTVTWQKIGKNCNDPYKVVTTQGQPVIFMPAPSSQNGIDSYIDWSSLYVLAWILGIIGLIWLLSMMPWSTWRSRTNHNHYYPSYHSGPSCRNDYSRPVDYTENTKTTTTTDTSTTRTYHHPENNHGGGH
ncbi:MAG: hypothetical protein NTX85_00680 [Candidatus Nomurabacteria bacterium]|nr:hypothetical protein [Candidatus Nomurabacteria bacterium]